MTNGGFVTWPQLDPLMRNMGERITRLEEKHASEIADVGRKENRRWMMITVILTGAVCPVIVALFFTWAHLRSVG